MSRRWSALLCVVISLTACHDAKPPAAEASEKKQADNDNGPGVTVNKESQARAGIKTQTLTAKAVQPELVAYGRLEEDPAASFVVHAAFAGILHAVNGQRWPEIGGSLRDGAEFGRIEPRLAFTDQMALSTQAANARADLAASTVSLSAAQAAYDRARALNADNKNISDRALEEAAAKLASEKARHDAAVALLPMLQRPAARPLIAERGGEVVEVMAQPGESIEQGAPVVRLARFDRLIARIDLPVGQAAPPPGAMAHIVPAGFEDRAPLAAERIGVASATDPHSQSMSLLYKLTGTMPGLRPGVAVSARFPMPGTPVGQGVLIPRAAVVQQEGRSWVFVQTKGERFDRRPLSTDVPVASGFIVTRGFMPGDRVVVTGAQSLLSEEFKSQNEADTN